jgi:hypothetical protein
MLFRQYAGNVWLNILAFMKADFHLDEGMRNLIDAFYCSIRSGGAPPIPYREILLTAAIMDDIFSQLSSGAGPGPSHLIEALPAASLMENQL